MMLWFDIDLTTSSSVWKEGFGIATTKLTWFSNLYGQEYVIVLVKNGKRKEDARNELRVFLDGDTDSFVSW